jgi:hypothetical protein
MLAASAPTENGWSTGVGYPATGGVFWSGHITVSAWGSVADFGNQRRRNGLIAGIRKDLVPYPPLTLYLDTAEKQLRIYWRFSMPRINAVRFHVIQNK